MAYTQPAAPLPGPQPVHLYDTKTGRDLAIFFRGTIEILIRGFKHQKGSSTGAAMIPGLGIL